MAYYLNRTIIVKSSNFYECVYSMCTSIYDISIIAYYRFVHSIQYYSNITSTKSVFRDVEDFAISA
jgi:hypothetical protein